MADTHADPTREEIDRLSGAVVIEFGADWCPHCQAIQTDMGVLTAAHPDVRRIKIEDGPGRPLGRSFRVKLWPTLVFLRDGRVLLQVARPSVEAMQEGFAALAASSSSSSASS